jgi:SAM-dependent methyltransferase
MKINPRSQNVQNKFNTKYSGVQELLDTEQGLQFFSKDLVKKMKKGLKIEKGKDVLDFGAGTGFLAEIWREKYEIDPICLEIDPDLVDVLVAKKFKVFQEMDQIQDVFEFIYTSNVLEHIQDDVAVLIDIKNKMCVNGKLAIYVPALPILFSDFDASIGHFRRYSKKELIKKVTDAGLEVENCYWNDSLGVLASLAVKFLGYEGKLKIGYGKLLFIYDKIIFPASKILDSIIFKHLIGKNLFLIAKNSNLSRSSN